MNRERLLKLADYLDTVPSEQFDFRKIIKESDTAPIRIIPGTELTCGYICCALGGMPFVWPDNFEISYKLIGNKPYRLDVQRKGVPNTNRETVFDHAIVWFDLPKEIVDFLFVPCEYLWGDYWVESFPLLPLSGSASPVELAERIRYVAGKTDEELRDILDKIE